MLVRLNPTEQDSANEALSLAVEHYLRVAGKFELQIDCNHGCNTLGWP